MESGTHRVFVARGFDYRTDCKLLEVQGRTFQELLRGRLFIEYWRVGRSISYSEGMAEGTRPTVGDRKERTGLWIITDVSTLAGHLPLKCDGLVACPWFSMVGLSLQWSSLKCEGREWFLEINRSPWICGTLCSVVRTLTI